VKLLNCGNEPSCILSAYGIFSALSDPGEYLAAWDALADDAAPLPFESQAVDCCRNGGDGVDLPRCSSPRPFVDCYIISGYAIVSGVEPKRFAKLTSESSDPVVNLRNANEDVAVFWGYAETTRCSLDRANHLGELARVVRVSVMDITNIAARVARELGTLVCTGIDDPRTQRREIHLGLSRKW